MGFPRVVGCSRMKSTSANFLAPSKCSNKDASVDMGTIPDPVQTKKMDNIVVDIADCTNNNFKLENEDDPDATEYSSSFGRTMSGSDEEHASTSCDDEVNSEFRSEKEAPMVFDGSSRLFSSRKRRLTAQWKGYSHSLSWRCKWVELRLHNLQSQAKNYEIALLASAKQKHPKTEEIKTQNSVSRFLPLSSQNKNKHIMKRQKRIRMEDRVDIGSYMSCHNLFAYYEKRKFEIDGSVDDEGTNQVMPVEPTRFRAEDFEADVEVPSYKIGEESSLEQMLWTIEVLKSRVASLKTEWDNVVSEHPVKISTGEDLGQRIQGALSPRATQNETITPENGHVIPVAYAVTPLHNISENEHEEAGVSASATFSLGDATSLPDLVESTGVILPGSDASLDQPRINGSCEEALDDNLLNDQAAEKPLQVKRCDKELSKEKNAASQKSVKIYHRRKRGEISDAPPLLQTRRVSKRCRVAKKPFDI